MDNEIILTLGVVCKANCIFFTLQLFSSPFLLSLSLSIFVSFCLHTSANERTLGKGINKYIYLPMSEVATEGGAPASVDLSTVSTAHSLHSLNRVRRSRQQYEHLQQPEGVVPGDPVPSIEGWVVFLTGLPPSTKIEDVQDIFAQFKAGDENYFGNIRNVKLPLTAECTAQGYALVELDSKEGFTRAIGELTGVHLTFAEKEQPDGSPYVLRVSAAFVAEVEEEENSENDEAVVGDKRRRDDDGNEEETSADEAVVEKRGRTEGAGNEAE